MSYQIQLCFEDQSVEFECEASDTIMEGARRRGIFLASYCEQGGCGACTSLMKKGAVAYMRSVRGIPQDPVPGDMIRPCSAMPLEDLKLEPLSRWKAFSK